MSDLSADTTNRQTALNAPSLVMNVNTSDNPPVYDNLNTIIDTNNNQQQPPPYPGTKI